MRIVRRTRYQRVTNFAFAFVLAISSIAAAGPFVVSQRANAVSGTQTVCATGCNFNDLQAAGVVRDEFTDGFGTSWVAFDSDEMARSIGK